MTGPVKKITLVFGTRPEAIKLAPVALALRDDLRFETRVWGLAAGPSPASMTRLGARSSSATAPAALCAGFRSPVYLLKPAGAMPKPFTPPPPRGKAVS